MLGISTTAQTALIHNVDRVAPAPIRMSSMNETITRETVRTARNRSAGADGSHDSPYTTLISDDASAAISTAIGSTTANNSGTVRCTPADIDSSPSSLRREKPAT